MCLLFSFLRFILTRKCLYYISERPINKSHCLSRDSFSRSDWFLIKYELNRESKKSRTSSYCRVVCSRLKLGRHHFSDYSQKKNPVSKGENLPHIFKQLVKLVYPCDNYSASHWIMFDYFFHVWKVKLFSFYNYFSSSILAHVCKVP